MSRLATSVVRSSRKSCAPSTSSGSTPADEGRQSARDRPGRPGTLPMMATAASCVVLRAERILKPKRGKEARGRRREDEPASDRRTRGLRQEPGAADDAGARGGGRRSQRGGSTSSCRRHATIVECWGLKAGRDTTRAGSAPGGAAGRGAGQAGGRERRAADRACGGPPGGRAGRHRHRDAARRCRAAAALRGAASRRSPLEDAQEVVSGGDLAGRLGGHQCDPAGRSGRGAAAARAGARERRRVVSDPRAACLVRAREAGRHRSEAGARRRWRRCSATDLDLKSSGGDPRVLLERLVVELCRK